MIEFLPLLYTVVGLVLFEMVNSIDNAVINAEVLTTLPAKSRRWFLRFGLLFAVIGMRGVLPWLIVWLSLPGISFWRAFTIGFSKDLETSGALQHAASGLLIASGSSLLLIFLYWALVEHGFKKNQFLGRAITFLIVAAVLLLSFAYGTPGPPQFRPMVVGTILFFIIWATKRLAAVPRTRMSVTAAKRAKMVYLEVLDTIFSIETVLASFAFTFSVPLIMLGNGLGSILVRVFTTSRSRQIHKLQFLKRGAMYAIGFLSVIMLLHGIGVHLPIWMTLVTTLISMGLAFIQINKMYE